MTFSRAALRCLAVLAALFFVAPALAALVSCDVCGAFNAPDAVKCSVCGGAVKRAAASSGPKASPLPSPTATDAPPPTPVPSVKTVNPEPALPTLPTLPEPEPAESPEPAPSTPARPAPPETGNLVLESEPSGATVRLRGRAAGNTPLRRALDAGTYRIAMSLKGHATERMRLRVRGGETVRRVISLTKLEEPDDDRSGKHGSHLLSPPSPSPAVRGTERGPAGTLVIELVKYGEHTTASSFEVELDGAPSGQGKLSNENLSSRFVRTFRYQRSVPPGVHAVKLTLLGMSAVHKNGTLHEAAREFEIQVAPGRTTTLFHTWAGGIEDFARAHACCTRGHRRP